MYEVSAKGLCPICFEPVWDNEASTGVNGRVYHAECYREVEARVE